MMSMGVPWMGRRAYDHQPSKHVVQTHRIISKIKIMYRTHALHAVHVHALQYSHTCLVADMMIPGHRSLGKPK